MRTLIMDNGYFLLFFWLFFVDWDKALPATLRSSLDLPPFNSFEAFLGVLLPCCHSSLSFGRSSRSGDQGPQMNSERTLASSVR